MDDIRRGGEEAKLRADVVKVALDHHLVSAYTSLVAVDVTPTGPVDGSAKSALVKASLPQGWQGAVPQTDASTAWHLLMGLLALSIAGIVALIGRAVPAGRSGPCAS
jgi:Ca-activated chloride channel family protein